MDLQFNFSPTVSDFINSEKTITILIASLGEGKCLAKGTPVLMADGTIRPVEEIEDGDQVMGDDGTLRNVTGTVSGRAEMFKIVPVKGEPFVANGPHILVLKESKNGGGTVQISVDDYLKLPKWRQDILKLYRTPLDFPEQLLPIPPYLFGLWLGDGVSVRAEIATAEPEIVSYLREQAQGMGLRLVEKTFRPNSTGENKSKGYQFSGVQGSEGWGQNPFVSFINQYGLLGNKHIPQIYKANSRENRLQLLAGLIDTDGWINHEGYQTIQKNQQLAEGIAFLARSLGLAAYVKPRKKNGFGIEGIYYHVMISGDCSCIPVKLDRKKCQPRSQKKDVLVTGIKRIEAIGKNDYYGFTLDGNHRFLLGDFTVTHNTFGAIGAMIAHAKRCGQPIRCAILRDTLENIKLSIVPSIQEFFQDIPQAYRFKNEFKELTIFSDPRVDVDLFGIDDPASLGKLQGSSAYSLIWLNEPAPIADKANAGLSEEVYNVAVIRCVRHKGTPGRLIVDMNPADESHWTYRRFILEPDFDPEFPLIQKQVWHVPYGENKKLGDDARQAAMKMYANDPASYARYVLGEFAVIYRGQKVTPYYKRSLHLLPYPAEPVPGLDSFRLWDSWGAPCCILGQVTTIGRLIVYDVCLIEGNSDLRTLIRTQVEPLLNSPRWKNKAKSWRDIGDFTMAMRDQSNVEESAKLVIQRAFKGRFESGPSTWKMVKQGLDDMFERNGLIQGLPSVQLDPAGAKILDRALNGAWHYPVDNSGQRTREKPVKDSASHPGDAFANGCAVLRPSSRKADIRAYQASVLKQKKRAQSYAVAGGGG
jgi:hypothetical protein